MFEDPQGEPHPHPPTPLAQSNSKSFVTNHVSKLSAPHILFSALERIDWNSFDWDSKGKSYQMFIPEASRIVVLHFDLVPSVDQMI